MYEEKFAEDALHRFREICEDAVSEQKNLLKHILQKNKDTEYGRRYCFSDIKDPLEFQRKVPLTVFEDYEESITRQIQGEENVLTAEKPVFYCISAGSTGTPKYLPITVEDVRQHHFYEDGVVIGGIREYFADLRWDEIFGCTFELGEFFRTYMEDGTPNGVRSGIYFRYAQENGTFSVDSCCVPWEVFFPEKIEDLLYVKVRFALERADVTGIHGVFAHKMLRTFRFIEKNWDLLLDDMEYGKVSSAFGISKEWEEFLLRMLSPNPARAAYLRRISRQDLKDGMLRKIWPSLKYLRVIGGSLFQIYTEELRIYAKDVPMHFFAYAASESYLGVAAQMECPDAYVLLADTCYYEFLPMEDNSGKEKEDRENAARPVPFWEAEAGKEYELIITTLSGLYRYRLGDVVEIVGWQGQAPVVRVCYRLGQGLNLADENMNMYQMQSAVEDFCRKFSVSAVEYCFSGDCSGEGPCYRLFMEMDGELPGDAGEKLDACLCEASLGYKGARNLGELEVAQVTQVPLETFQAYEQNKSRDGGRTEQRKPARILKSKEDREFFGKHVQQKTGETQEKGVRSK